MVRGLTSDPAHGGAVRETGLPMLQWATCVRWIASGLPARASAAPSTSRRCSLRMGSNVISAADSAGVRRLVFSSVIHSNLKALEHHGAKAPAERMAQAMGLCRVNSPLS